MKLDEIQPLVDKAMGGDKKAYAELCEKIVRDVLYVCIKITGSVHLGEDAAQETLIKLGTQIKKLKKADAFPTWLNRCISTTCRNYLRSERRQKGHKTQELFEEIMENNIEFLPEE